MTLPNQFEPLQRVGLITAPYNSLNPTREHESLQQSHLDDALLCLLLN